MTHRARPLAPRVPRRIARRRRRTVARLSHALRPARRRRADDAPRSTPGWSIRPDDTVVIRVARSEMGRARYRPRPARGRGARVRLGEGHHRVPDARREPRAQPRLGRLLDRRQPRHPRVARLRAQGRRRGAHDAGAGRGQRVEGAGRRMQRRQRRHHAQAARPHDDLRQGGRGRRRSSTPPKDVDAQGPEGLEDRRQAAEAPRHARQADRQADLRHRPQAARHARTRRSRSARCSAAR